MTHNELQFRQSTTSIEKNIGFFDRNEAYQWAQERFEIYRLIRLSVTHELRGVQSLLDIGNGGFFNYPVETIPEVIACDLMLNDGHPLPNVRFKRGSILELPFEDAQFDCVLAQNVLHHVTGDTPPLNETNMHRALAECSRVLKPEGKLVLIESTVPAWFYYLIEYPAYALLARLWRFRHPLTFQYTRRQIAEALEAWRMHVEEQLIIPRGNWVIQFGVVVPTLLTPVQAMKFVAVHH